VLTDTDPEAQVVLIGEGDNVPQVLLNAANNIVALSARTPPENHRIAMHESGSGPHAKSGVALKPSVRSSGR